MARSTAHRVRRRTESEPGQPRVFIIEQAPPIRRLYPGADWLTTPNSDKGPAYNLTNHSALTCNGWSSVIT